MPKDSILIEKLTVFAARKGVKLNESDHWIDLALRLIKGGMG